MGSLIGNFRPPATFGATWLPCSPLVGRYASSLNCASHFLVRIIRGSVVAVARSRWFREGRAQTLFGRRNFPPRSWMDAFIVLLVGHRYTVVR